MYLFIDSYRDEDSARHLAESIKRSCQKPDKIQILTVESTDLSSVTASLGNKHGAAPEYRFYLMLACLALLIKRAVRDWNFSQTRSLIVGGRASLLKLWEQIPDNHRRSLFSDPVAPLLSSTRHIVVQDPSLDDDGASGHCDGIIVQFHQEEFDQICGDLLWSGDRVLS